MMNVNHFTVVHDNESSDTNYSAMNQMMPLASHYNSIITPTTTTTVPTHDYVSLNTRKKKES